VNNAITHHKRNRLNKSPERSADEQPRSTKARKRALPEETSMPKFVEPQLATLVSTVPEDDGWLHELKFDGYRVFCRIDNGKIAMLTRSAQDWTARFGVLARAAKLLPARQAIIDGEIVALDADGSHSFQKLQNSLRDGDAARLIYYAFDLLYVNGRDLRALSLLERKKLLRNLVARRAKARAADVIRYSEYWLGRGQEIFAKACGAGLEGIIAKRVDDPYRSGRGRSWLKIKCSKSQEFVIAGYTDPAGSRSDFGALLLGFHDSTGALRYAGRVGTGFDHQTLRTVGARLKKLEKESSPFAGAPKGADFRGVHWVEPMLVAEVVFTDWTSDGLLRHPSFQGLREDKPAAEIIREIAAPVPRKNSHGGKKHRRRN
jgi:bifunctional non-homologous end joining protein LigD